MYVRPIIFSDILLAHTTDHLNVVFALPCLTDVVFCNPFGLNRHNRKEAMVDEILNCGFLKPLPLKCLFFPS